MILIMGLMVILMRNPVHSVLSLIMCLIFIASSLIAIGAEYIGLTLIIVYVGAVAVLFLFVVMMMDIDIAMMQRSSIKSFSLYGLLALVLFINFYMLIREPEILNSANDLTNTEAIAMSLFNDYLLELEMLAIVLLVAMIGAIALTLRVGGSKKQSIRDQIERRSKIEMIDIKPKSGAVL